MVDTVMISDALEEFVLQEYGSDAEAIMAYLPSFPIKPNEIKAVMINEVVADRPEEDFYSAAQSPYYMQTTSALFQKAGVAVGGMQDILDMGVYVTSALKLPKPASGVDTADIRRYVSLLKKELALFSALKAVMLMGDVARKAVNIISKGETGKNALPAVSTYKLRHSEIWYEEVRLFPAYIMTGKNLAIEKSKMEMSAEELAKMLAFISR